MTATVPSACVKRANLDDVKPYDLRKFAATRIYKATGSIPVTMQFTGHRNPNTLLQHYVFAERDAAENMRHGSTGRPHHYGPLSLESRAVAPRGGESSSL